VETSYLNTDVCKFESSQKDGSIAHLADSLKAFNKLRAFNNVEPLIINIFNQAYTINIE